MKKLNYLYVIIPILIIIENFGYYIEMNIIIDPYSIYFLNIFDDLLYRGILGPFAEENIFRGGVLILLLIFFYFMISIGIIILIFIKFSNYMSDGEKIRFLLFKLKYMLNIEINKYLGGIGKEDFRKNILNQLLIIPIFLSFNWYFAEVHSNYGNAKISLVFLSGLIYIIGYYYKGIMLAFIFHAVNNLSASFSILYFSGNSNSFYICYTMILIVLDLFFMYLLDNINMEKRKMITKWIITLICGISFYIQLSAIILGYVIPPPVIGHIQLNSMIFLLVIIIFVLKFLFLTSSSD